MSANGRERARRWIVKECACNSEEKSRTCAARPLSRAKRLRNFKYVYRRCDRDRSRDSTFQKDDDDNNNNNKIRDGVMPRAKYRIYTYMRESYTEKRYTMTMTFASLLPSTFYQLTDISI